MCVCVSSNVAGGHISISNPISRSDGAAERLAAGDSSSVADEAGERKPESTTEPGLPLWGRRGHVAFLCRNIKQMTLESGLATDSRLGSGLATDSRLGSARAGKRWIALSYTNSLL